MGNCYRIDKGNCNAQHKWNGYDTDEITEMAKVLTAGM